MATIEDVITFSQNQVIDSLSGSVQFIDELAQAVSWQSAWESIDTSRIASPDNINIERWGIPARPTSPNFTWNESLYDTPLFNEARNILLNDLRFGGYGIDPNDEQALWERAKDRESKNAESAIQDFQRSMTARGFSIPNGAMLAGIQKVQQQARGAISTINRDISIKRADMYVQARQFTITHGVSAEQFMTNYYSSFASRTMDSIRLLFEKSNLDFKVWEAVKSDAIKDAEFALNKWAKDTEKFLSIAKIQLEEKNSISANEHNITAEGITAASKALETYNSIITAANNAASAITTLSS